MIALQVEVPYASFRKSFARSYAETYAFPPPATVYGMLLSLVGEWQRVRHEGVALAFAYANRPRVTTTLRRLSRYKYGVASKQEELGNAPDYIESLCDTKFLCWVNSSQELVPGESLESRITKSIQTPEKSPRKGVLSLGLSDDVVDSVKLVDTSRVQGSWHWLSPCPTGMIDLPIWVDHVGSINTYWRRFQFNSDLEFHKDDQLVNKFTRILRKDNV
jgi:CRISPR-associated protein Cas5t